MNIIFESEGVSNLVKGMCFLHYQRSLRMDMATRRHEFIDDLKAYGIDETRSCAKEITNVLLLLPNTYRVYIRLDGPGSFRREMTFDCQTKAAILETYLRLYDVHYRFMYKAILDIAGWYVEVNRKGIGSFQMYSSSYFALRYPHLYERVGGDFMQIYERQRELVD